MEGTAMMRKCIWLVLLVSAIARPQDSSDSEESQNQNSTDDRQTFQSVQHLKYDGNVVLQPDDNVITADRIRALLRSGFTAVRVGNQTFGNLNPQKPLPATNASTPSPTKPTSPPTTTTDEEEISGDTEDTKEPSTSVTIPPTKHPKAVVTASTQPTTPEIGFVTEAANEDEEETSSEAPHKPTKRIHSSTKPTQETDEDLVTPGAHLQVLQAQFKRIKSATIRDDSDDDTTDTTDAPIDATTGHKGLNVFQLLRGFASLSPPTPPPSPFDLSKKHPSLSKTRKTVTPSPDDDEEDAEATIPFEETTTTIITTEVPMPPPVQDYIPASKQLSPFVSGVRDLESGSTRDALDAASQMGKLTWLVNYYESPQQTGH